MGARFGRRADTGYRSRAMPGKEVRLHVRVGDDLRLLLRNEAARVGMSDSQFVREAIIAYAAWRRGIESREVDPDVDLLDPAVVARLLGYG